MNYIESIVKILESPKYKKIGKNTYITEFRAQLPQIRQRSKIVRLVIWGKLALDTIDYYEINDYILIEGYLFLEETSDSNSLKQNLKKVKIKILKVYPFLLDSNRFIK